LFADAPFLFLFVLHQFWQYSFEQIKEGAAARAPSDTVVS